MTTKPDQGAERVRALRNILAMEAENGFQNKAVAGGLERFLATLQQEESSHPLFRTLAEHGLLTVDYGELSAERRERWAAETQRFLGDLPAAKPARPARTGGAGRKAPPPAPTPRPPSPALSLDAPVSRLRSVGPANERKLRKLGAAAVRDLVYHFPNRHLDYSRRRTVAQLADGEEQTVVATVWEAHEVQLGRGGKLRATEAVVGDETGNIRVIWFGQPWLARDLQRAIASASRTVNGTAQIVLSGKVSAFNGRPQFEHPEWELLDDPDAADLVHTGRLVPVYPSTEGLQPRAMRLIVREALDGVTAGGKLQVDDPIPDAVRRDLALLTLPEALAQAHYPDSQAMKERARRRLAFDELLVLQLAIAGKRSHADQQPGIELPAFPEIVRSFIASLPFQLTKGQESALGEAMADVSAADRPMSRLLQGDVGSGKTVVALAMLLTAVAGGYQGAMMAPTEVLAEQHFLNVRRLLSGAARPVDNPDWFGAYLEGRKRPVTIGLLTGSTRAAPRRELNRMAADGVLDILVGTHALIQQEVELPELALAVVDEQHRFGVLQRAALRGKGADPHLLLLSATPIPRTLAQTVYGDMDVSTMPELPHGRKRVITRIVPPARSSDTERFLVEQAAGGRQCFVVCPLIDESEAVLARAATAEYERLRKGALADCRTGLLHGRMALAEKQEVMDRFRRGELDVLVTTPVIEVGIDVPNATVMMIEGADRFGLAQLHQLRGRVGRGAHQSYCFLLSEALSEDAKARLDVLVRTDDGFEIAEQDLRLRGAGDFFGTRQSGLPTLEMARLDDDRDLLAQARTKAAALLAADPRLDALPALRDAVTRYANAVTDERA